jgi:LysM repeat protein
MIAGSSGKFWPAAGLLFAAMALLVVSCGLVGGDEGAGGATVRGVVLSTEQVGPDGAPLGPRNLFPPTAREIRATVIIDGAEAGMKITGRWYQLGTSSSGTEGSQINASDVILDATTAQNNQARVTFIQRPGASGFPEDNWLLRVYINDELAKTAGFAVTQLAAVGAPVAPAPAAAVPVAPPATYTVAAGDTLATVTERFRGTEAAASYLTKLATLNGIAATAPLTPGTVLKLPPAQ